MQAYLKKTGTLILLLIAILIHQTALAQLPTSVLVSWYPFCGNTVDRGTNTYDMANANLTPVVSRFGNAGFAYEFNGTNSQAYYSVPFSTTVSGNLTYSCWVYPYTNQNSILIYNGSSSTNGLGLILCDGTASGAGNKVAVFAAGSVLYVGPSISLNAWHNIILRKTGSTFELVIDNNLAGTFTGSYIAPTGSFNVGLDHTLGNRPFYGRLDDIAIYHSSLSNLELAQLYTYNPDITPFTLGNDTILCNTTSITLAPSAFTAGTSTLWFNGTSGPSVSVNATGAYWYRVTKNLGCSVTDTLHVTNNMFSFNILSDTVICPGDSVRINAHIPTGAEIIWSTGLTDTSVLFTVADTYTVIAINGGCFAYDTLRLGFRPQPVFSLGPDTTLCNYNPVLLQPDVTYSGVKYLWNTGDTTVSVTATTPGIHWLQMNLNGCTYRDAMTINYLPSPYVNFGRDTAICQGKTLVLSAITTASSVNNWSTGATGNSITVNSAGTYWFYSRDNTCVATDTIVVTIKPIPAVTLGTDLSACAGIPLTLQSSTTYGATATFAWSTGASTDKITVTTPGTYTLTVTENGCSNSDDINVVYKAFPNAYLGPDTVICDSTSITYDLTGTATSTFIWSTGNITPILTVTEAGTYGVTVTDNGCVSTDTVYIKRVRDPKVYLGPDTTVCYDFVLNYYVNGDDANYLWSNGSTQSNVAITTPGTYWARVTNVCGVATDAVNINFKPCDLWIPNAFSPNDDGRNDILQVGGTLSMYSDFKFFVYNRWGNVIYSGTSITDGWDGKYNGVPQEIGTYYYLITFKREGTGAGDMKGDFTLVR